MIPCTKGTSGIGLILNLSGSSDPTVYRSMACISIEGLYNFVPNAVSVHTVESKFMSLSSDSTLMGTFSCCSILAVWVVGPSTALTTLPHFPGSDIHDKFAPSHTEGKSCSEGTRVVWVCTE